MMVLIPRISWQAVQGRPILVLDLSGSSPDESLDLLAEFSVLIKEQSDPVRILINATDASYEASITNKWKALWLQHHAKILALSIYGSSGLMGIAMRSFIEAMELLRMPQARQKMGIFNSRQEAVTWLIKKDRTPIDLSQFFVRPLP
jgi:hypothetical protein